MEVHTMLTFISWVLCLACFALAVYTASTIDPIAFFILLVPTWVFYRIATRKGRKAERQRKKANGEYVSPIEGIFSLLLVIILLPFHLLFGRSKKPKPESAAERYLRESKEYYAKDLARYQANKAMRENMLDEARRLEEQARYQPGYARKETRKKVDRLRREAGRL